MSKHTKGPWEYEDRIGTGILIKAYIEKPRQMQPIYRVSLTPSVMITKDGKLCIELSYSDWRQFPSDDWRKMQRANARLIASAPELLEACKRFIASSSCKNGCSPDDMTCDTQFAKKIIAKAEGK